MVVLLEELVFRILFIVMYAIFAATRIFYRQKASKTRKEQSDEPSKAKTGWNWVNIAMSISIVGMFISYILFLLFPPSLPWFPLPFPSVLRWLGVILGFCTIPFLIWTHRTLGHFWSAELEIQDQHRLITSGPYSRIRHPMYTAFILFTLSTVLLAANLFVAIFGLLVCVLFYPVTQQEEQLFLNEFGDEYQEYMNRTGRFLPRIRQPKQEEKIATRQQEEV